MSLPAVALRSAVVITDPRLPRVAALAALLLAAGACARVPLAPSYGVSPEPWQPATADVLARARPGDCVAFYPAGRPQGVRSTTSAGRAGRRRRRARSCRPCRWGAVTPYVERYATLSPAAGLVARPPAAGGCGSSPATRARRTARRARCANRAGYLRLDAALEQAFGHGPDRAVRLRQPDPRPAADRRASPTGRGRSVRARSVCPTNVSTLSPASSTPFTHTRTANHLPLDVAPHDHQRREGGDQHPRVGRTYSEVNAREGDPGRPDDRLGRHLAARSTTDSSITTMQDTAPTSPTTRLRLIVGWLKWRARSRGHARGQVHERQRVGLLAPAVVLGDVVGERVARPDPQEQREGAGCR